jgi:hypothetical protein
MIVRVGFGSREIQLFMSTSTETQATFVVSQTSGTNLMSLAHAYFNLLIVLTQVRSCLEFDLTLSMIPSDLVASSCFSYLYMLYSVLLASRKLIGSKINHLDSRSTFPQCVNLSDRTYPSLSRTYPVYTGHICLEAKHIRPP